MIVIKKRTKVLFAVVENKNANKKNMQQPDLNICPVKPPYSNHFPMYTEPSFLLSSFFFSCFYLLSFLSRLQSAGGESHSAVDAYMRKVSCASASSGIGVSRFRLL